MLSPTIAQLKPYNASAAGKHFVCPVVVSQQGPITTLSTYMRTRLEISSTV